MRTVFRYDDKDEDGFAYLSDAAAGIVEAGHFFDLLSNGGRDALEDGGNRFQRVVGDDQNADTG